MARVRGHVHRFIYEERSGPSDTDPSRGSREKHSAKGELVAISTKGVEAVASLRYAARRLARLHDVVSRLPSGLFFKHLQMSRLRSIFVISLLFYLFSTSVLPRPLKATSARCIRLFFFTRCATAPYFELNVMPHSEIASMFFTCFA